MWRVFLCSIQATFMAEELMHWTRELPALSASVTIIVSASTRTYSAATDGTPYVVFDTLRQWYPCTAKVVKSGKQRGLLSSVHPNSFQ